MRHIETFSKYLNRHLRTNAGHHGTRWDAMGRFWRVKVIISDTFISEVLCKCDYLTEKVEELSVMVSKLQAVQTLKERKPIEVDVACNILKKAKPTIYSLVRKGVLPAYKKGKKLYFYEDELLQWIETGRKETSQQTYDEMLATMQSGVRHKPKSLLNR